MKHILILPSQKLPLLNHQMRKLWCRWKMWSLKPNILLILWPKRLKYCWLYKNIEECETFQIFKIKYVYMFLFCFLKIYYSFHKTVQIRFLNSLPSRILNLIILHARHASWFIHFGEMVKINATCFFFFFN